jgi:4'-phosphopantetheinyl transferase
LSQFSDVQNLPNNIRANANIPRKAELNQRTLLNVAHAWRVYPDDLPPRALARRCLAWLAPQERALHQKFKTPELRHLYLVSRALCRCVLSKYTGVDPADWKFTAGKFGKPAIAAPAAFRDLRFNLTHTAGLVICIVTRAGEVGVDAEEISPRVDIEQVARHFFSKPERAALAGLPSRQRSKRFFEQWVLKEAYLKGRGKGLFVSPEKITIKFDAKGRPLPIGNWQLALHRVGPKHVAATAVRPKGRTEPIPIIWFSLKFQI